MNDKMGTIKELVEGFLWSIFIGVVGISIGLGALYPPLNYVAKPFVCPTGQMTFEKHMDQATPSQTFYSADWYCTKGAATTEPESGSLSISPFASAGVFYGLLCFPLFLLGRYYFKRKEVSREKKITKQRN
jgi:hypothetical protein